MSLQQIKKGLLTLVVRTSLRGGAGCGPEAQLCRSRSLSSSSGLARVSADYSYLNSSGSDTPRAPGDRVVMEIILHKGQPNSRDTTTIFLIYYLNTKDPLTITQNRIS